MNPRYWLLLRLLVSVGFYAWIWPHLPWPAVKTALGSARLGYIGLALALFWAALELRRRGLTSLALPPGAGVVRWHESLVAWLLALAAGFLNQPLNDFAGIPGWFYAVGWVVVVTLLVGGNWLFFRGKATPKLLLVALATQALLLSAGLCLMFSIAQTPRPLEYAMLLAGAQVMAPLTVAGAGFREMQFVLLGQWLPVEVGEGVAVSLFWLGLLGLAAGFQVRQYRP
jgi:hypothetical protein